jgi:hypothetical protein
MELKLHWVMTSAWALPRANTVTRVDKADKAKDFMETPVQAVG